MLRFRKSVSTAVSPLIDPTVRLCGYCGDELPFRMKSVPLSESRYLMGSNGARARHGPSGVAVLRIQPPMF